MTIYVDADACPVKDEVYRVAERLQVPVIVVANTRIKVPTSPLFSLVIKLKFGEVDDWIAEVCQADDIVITADIPLAARAIDRLAIVIDPRGNRLTQKEIGHALAQRDLMHSLREAGTITGGPAPFGKKDRSAFLSALDQTIHKIQQASKRKATTQPTGDLESPSSANEHDRALNPD